MHIRDSTLAEENGYVCRLSWTSVETLPEALNRRALCCPWSLDFSFSSKVTDAPLLFISFSAVKIDYRLGQFIELGFDALLAARINCNGTTTSRGIFLYSAHWRRKVSSLMWNDPHGASDSCFEKTL